MPPPPRYNQQYYTPPPPPQQQQPHGWVDPALYNGPGQYQPQQPLPAYSQRDPTPQQHQESFEMNQWQNTTTPPPPTLPPHRDQRPHNEGII